MHDIWLHIASVLHTAGAIEPHHDTRIKMPSRRMPAEGGRGDDRHPP